MKIKFTEFRYFMVEMLSILIIVGVLFVAGIIRYQDALAYQAGTVRDLLEKRVENVKPLGTYQVGKVVFEEEKTVATEDNTNWIEKMFDTSVFPEAKRTEDNTNWTEKMFDTSVFPEAKRTEDNTNWTEKMLLAAITDDFGLYFECTSNMDMSSYLQQPHSVTALKLAMMHDSYGFIISLIGDAAYQESKNNNNVDSTQGVYSYLKQEVSQDDLLQALRDNPIKSLPQEDQEWATNFVAQVFASEKFTKADEMAIQLMKYPARGIFRHLLPNALHFLAKNDFKISQSEKMEQYISDIELKVNKILQSYMTVDKVIDQDVSSQINDKQQTDNSTDVNYKVSSDRE